MALSTKALQRSCFELEVFVQDRPVGVIELQGDRYVFQYYPKVASGDFVSLLMPVRSRPYLAEQMGLLLPVFDMNLPEGSLRQTLERRFAKVVSGFNDLALLALVGQNSIGRLGFGAPLNSKPPSLILESLVHAQDDDELLEQLYAREAVFSGVAGMQPKALASVKHVEIEKLSDAEAPGQDMKSTLRDEQLIIKAGTTRTPWIAANEFYCLRAAHHVGLQVPQTRLLKGGQILLVDRFDRWHQSNNEVVFAGAEDVCALTGKVSAMKYDGTYERIAKTLTNFISLKEQPDNLAQFFQSLVLSCTVRNGDAHLKNFTLLYGSFQDEQDVSPSLSPVYDVCTTNVYLPADQLALTLDGSKRYANEKKLSEFGQRHCGMTKTQVRDVFEKVRSGVEMAAKELREYGALYPDFHETVGAGMLKHWETGMAALQP